MSARRSIYFFYSKKDASYLKFEDVVRVLPIYEPNLVASFEYLLTLGRDD